MKTIRCACSATSAAHLPIHRREKDAGDPGFTLATAVFRIAGDGVDYEMLDDLRHPPVHRGEVRTGAMPDGSLGFQPTLPASRHRRPR